MQKVTLDEMISVFGGATVKCSCGKKFNEKSSFFEMWKHFYLGPFWKHHMVS